MMRVLSLFDGMSCGRFVLDKLNIPVEQYLASEVDKWAIKIAQKNFPDTIQMGDVRGVRQLCEVGALGEIDLLIGGSPCQNLSFAGKQDGFSVDIHTLDEYKRLVAEGFEFKGQSYLFWEYVWIKELLQPKWWLLENVRMKKEYLKIFNDVMGVEGVFINSALVSAQNRQRYYWCNWQVDQPEDRGLLLRDVLESGAVDREKSYCIDTNYHKGGSVENYKKKARRQVVMCQRGRGNNPGFEKEVDKCPSLTSSRWEQNHHVVTTCKLAGTTNGYNRQSSRIYDFEGKSPTLGGGNGGVNTPKVTTPHKVGEIKNGGIGNRIYDENGKAIALTSQSGGTAGAGNMLIKEKSNTIRVGGHGSPPDSRQSWDNALDSKLHYRKLTPIECERLQGLQPAKNCIIINICSDLRNNPVSVETKNLKSQKLAGNVENKELKGIVSSAQPLLNIKNRQTSKPALRNVHINLGENVVEIHNDNQKVKIVSIAEINSTDLLQNLKVDFAHLIVTMNTTLERITSFGEVELLQKSRNFLQVKNGKIVVKLCGEETTLLVENAEKNLTTLKKLLKYTTSDPSIRVSDEQILKTLFCFVVHVISGFIPLKTNKNYSLKIKLETGYTSGVSNTQRYRMLGNGWQCDTIEHIFLQGITRGIFKNHE